MQINESGFIIGKADQYFTLWRYSSDNQYTHFYYVKNLSMDLNEAIKKAKTNNIDYELRGDYFRRPFSKVYINNEINTIVDFGKYSGKTLKEIFEIDSQYFYWLADNCYNNSLHEIINNTSYIKEYKEKIEKDRLQRMYRIENPIGNWIGNIGDKIQIKIRIKNYFSWDTDFGLTTRYIMEDENHNIFTWKTSTYHKGFRKNTKWEIKGTIKDHNSYDGIKQTELTRCKIIK